MYVLSFQRSQNAGRRAKRGLKIERTADNLEGMGHFPTIHFYIFEREHKMCMCYSAYIACKRVKGLPFTQLANTLVTVSLLISNYRI